MAEQPPLSGAVFLSYASEDADAAARICEALRAAGVEVWFDKSELRGGDAWDSQIKKQIHDCALFVPLISAHTNARSEGYFRGEWHLATRRLHNMADDAAFLVPAVVDDTRETDARVPEEFFRAQWTWLPGGETPPAFAQRVRQLLGLDPVPAPKVKAAAMAAIEPSARSPSSVRPRGTPLMRRFGLPLIALLLGGAAFWYFQDAGDAPATEPVVAAAPSATAIAPIDQSIAVLPFVNMSPDKDQEYFADGIAEELLNLLAQVPDLKVIARTSSFAFKGKDVDIAEIAKKLNVAHVLEGSVRKSGNKVRITAQLIRTADSTHLWSETYDRTLDDIFAVQEEIALTVVQQLKLTLLGETPRIIPTDPEAYTLVLQANYLLSRATAEDHERAVELYKRALRIDPGYPLAWVGLSRVYSAQVVTGFKPPSEGGPLAREAAQQASKLNPDLASVQWALAYVAMLFDADPVATARHLARGLELDPRDVDLLSSATIFLASLGRNQQSLELGRRAVERDPEDPRTHFALGMAYFVDERWTESIHAFQAAVTLSPGFLWAQHFIGAALLFQGHPEAALAEFQKETDPEYRVKGVTVALHALGRRAEFEQSFARLRDEWGAEWPSEIAQVYALAGDPDRAFKWLDRASVQVEADLLQQVSQAFYRPLHDDPRWLPFLRKNGMAPEQLAAIKFEVKLPQ